MNSMQQDAKGTVLMNNTQKTDGTKKITHHASLKKKEEGSCIGYVHSTHKCKQTVKAR